MTDYFALLEQPRAPWLDPEALTKVFHAQTLRSHPDAQTQGENLVEREAAFAQLNEAYQTLRDPKRRLQHLLALEGTVPARDDAVPAEIEALFPAMARLLQDCDGVLWKASAATTALGRSLLRAGILDVSGRLEKIRATISQLHESTSQRLQTLNIAWAAGDPAVRAGLQELYVSFSYLSRWISELDEKRMQLSNAL
ncbi:MAG: DnaJ domain-containing protein [Verrucomicrobiota bacterium]|nr:DnaJ domain-containing protein [Verrucomicrobiota bacterium]